MIKINLSTINVIHWFNNAFISTIGFNILRTTINHYWFIITKENRVENQHFPNIEVKFNQSKYITVADYIIFINNIKLLTYSLINSLGYRINLSFLTSTTHH
ncbi:hypothetical protein ACTFIV_002562 [Dictyostelium citrinum]